MFVTTPAVVGVVDAVVGAVTAAMAAAAYGLAMDLSIALGLATFLSLLATLATLAVYQRRAFTPPVALPTVRFPTPTGVAPVRTVETSEPEVGYLA